MKPGRKNRLIELLLHPAMLALPVATLVILVLPDIFQPYKAELIKENVIEAGRRKTFCDLDKDGISEGITTKNNETSGAAIIVENKGSIVDQWNLKGTFNLKETQTIIGDSDNDNIDEIYALVYRNDSLLLYGIDFRLTGRFIIYDFFIAAVKTDPNRTMRIYSGKLTDLNGDGFKEIVFVHTNGFNLVPRRVYSVDLKNRQVSCSEELRTFLLGAEYADLDGDGLDEITLNNYSASNYKKDSLPAMHDHSAYTLALDNNLKLLFKPIEFPGNFNGCASYPYNTGMKPRIVTFTFKYENNPRKGLIQILDNKGRLIKRRVLLCEKEDGFNLLIVKDKPGSDQILVNYVNRKIAFLNSDLSIEKELDFQVQFDRDCLLDMDQDGIDEILAFTEKSGDVLLFRNNLSSPTVIKLPPVLQRPHISSVLNRTEAPAFLIQSDTRLSYFRYGENPLYYLKVPFYLAIYLCLLLFILLIHNLQRIQLRRKYDTEKRMAELQLLSLQSQMDPHFTFNVLNTIGSVILQSRKEESYDMLMKFSRLIRTTINSANKICRPLEEELIFVKNYLDLQQIRYQDMFTYKIRVEQGINTLQPVPKMILQTYVENALKHGLVPRRSDGELLVEVANRKHCLVLSVTDNGVGRQQARINGSVSTGVGLSIINQYYQVLNKNNELPITEEFTDLFDEKGLPAGTRVVVCIPEGFVFPGVPDGSVK
ncbi:MAG: histidine kinase [Bacteroidota bacterium]